VTTAGGLRARGKVRDVYDAGPGALLLVATDRLSAFDVVLREPVPDKGRVLTACSLFWFERTRDLVPNHVRTADPSAFPPPFTSDPELAGRSIVVERASVIPVECVARGFLSGSGWAQYRDGGSVCGVALPAGLRESDRLPEPIFTPTTKAETGHDLPLTFEQMSDLVGRGLAERLRELTVGIYDRVAQVALERGIIVADTKVEFGFAGGELVLIDEVGTPDSSRFWPLDGYEAGRAQPSFDKQFVRDWLDASGWDREPPPPNLPADVIDKTATKYREAYERVTGESWPAYLARMSPGNLERNGEREEEQA
jgi:phosphoribosylaminoimidazole-succinocarboxamide synthase